MARNGWISVYESERPKSGEKVLTLSYDGVFPAPEDMFADPKSRKYRILTYFNAGDVDHLAEVFYEVVFRKEGFYVKDEDSLPQFSKWHRRATIAERVKGGIVCWKHLDYPTPD